MTANPKMNAATTSPPANGCGGSDSDTNSDESLEYYQPISAVDNAYASEEEGEFPNQDLNPNFHRLPNGCLENGVSSLDLSEDDSENENEEVEEEIEPDRAIERAFREDERRRNAPLTAENAGRVMAAMSQISFGGSVPDWIGQVSEDQWINRLRGLRPPSADVSANSSTVGN